METSLITTKEAKIQAVELVGGTMKAKSMKESVHTFLNGPMGYIYWIIGGGAGEHFPKKSAEGM